ncbi:MAG: GNAT family N-acetyltransferase [bacterium]|nr:GNAT family N-acetyltransferase [bacterium]
MNKELRHTTLLVANGQIIASFSAVPLSPSVVYFSTLKVAKPFRRKGLAENLMRQAIESMREKGFVCGYAVTLSKKSEALVQKLGTGRIPREEMPRGVPLHLLDGKNGKKYQYWLFSFLKN